MSAPLPSSTAPRSRHLAAIVIALGLAQIATWGSLYYSVAVLAGPMAEGLGVSRSLVFGAFSAALGASGLASPWVGRAIDRLGGRRVLAGGSVLGALALAVLALAQGPVTLFAGWLLAGLAMAATLYDAAFPALSQVAGKAYRKALTALTLFGGFASTVYWPLAWSLESTLGWRATLGVFAAILLLVVLPLFWFGLQGAPVPAAPSAGPDTPAPQADAPAGPRFLWLCTAFAVSSFAISAIGAHVVGALGATRLPAAQAILAASLIGPAQVAGRVAELAFARRLVPIRVGMLSFGAMLLAMLLLWAAGTAPWLAFAFALLYGAANGAMTIVRGTVPAELFGRDAYGSLMGRIARPAFFAKAAAPLAVALLLANGNGYAPMAPLLAAVVGVALAAYLMAVDGRR
ncbi:MFS transporter [Pseudothauera rhizosphaerae]|nr:MFS transporter [Pseudothauera rhizosphaerae]